MIGDDKGQENIWERRTPGRLRGFWLRWLLVICMVLALVVGIGWMLKFQGEMAGCEEIDAREMGC